MAPPKVTWLTRDRLFRWLPTVLLIAAGIAISLPSLNSVRVDDLDSAHHIMDGIYFRDFLVDLPLLHPLSYTLSYYRQYPALGFVFWPPFFPLVEGVFFRLVGIDVRVARFCVLCFGLLFALSLYAVLKHQLKPLPRLIAVLLVLCTPLVAASYQQVMLEIPALGMGLLTVFVYQRAVGQSPAKWRDTLFFAGSAATMLYTKQTMLFVLPALLFDTCINHRAVLRTRQFWVAIILVILLVAPLAIFTLTVGKANIVQSVGSDKSFVLNSKAPPDRWSTAGWFFYPQRLPLILNSVPLILGVCGLLYGLCNITFLRAHAIWFGWVFSWYLIFGYFLNKQDRYAVFWIPGWITLSVAFAADIVRNKARIFDVRYAVFLIPLVSGFVAVGQIRIGGFDHVERMVASILDQKPSGNILYFGNHRQVMVPFVRKLDSSRLISIFRGDDLLAEMHDIRAVCKNYRVQFVLTESDDLQFRSVFGRVSGDNFFTAMGTYQVDTLRKPVDVVAFRYIGPMAGRSRVVQLRSPLIGEQTVLAR